MKKRSLWQYKRTWGALGAMILIFMLIRSGEEEKEPAPTKPELTHKQAEPADKKGGSEDGQPDLDAYLKRMDESPPHMIMFSDDDFLEVSREEPKRIPTPPTRRGIWYLSVVDPKDDLDLLRVMRSYGNLYVNEEDMIHALIDTKNGRTYMMIKSLYGWEVRMNRMVPGEAANEKLVGTGEELRDYKIYEETGGVIDKTALFEESEKEIQKSGE